MPFESGPEMFPKPEADVEESGPVTQESSGPTTVRDTAEVLPEDEAFDTDVPFPIEALDVSHHETVKGTVRTSDETTRPPHMPSVIETDDGDDEPKAA